MKIRSSLKKINIFSPTSQLGTMNYFSLHFLKFSFLVFAVVIIFNLAIMVNEYRCPSHCVSEHGNSITAKINILLKP